MRIVRMSGRILAVCLVVAGCAGCRDDEPTPQYNVNLGSGDRPLMPTLVSERDNAILSGRADMVQLADVSAPASGDATSGGDAEAIEALIESIRTAYTARDFEAAANLVVSRQRDILLPNVDAQAELAEAVDAFVEAAESIDPPSPVARQLLPGLTASLELPIDAGTVDVTSDTTATASMGMMNVQFEKEGEDWLFVVPMVAATAEQEGANITTVTQLMTDAAAAMEDESLTADAREERLREIMVQFQQVGTQSGG